jgi:hypothetical protein
MVQLPTNGRYLIPASLTKDGLDAEPVGAVDLPTQFQLHKHRQASPQGGKTTPLSSATLIKIPGSTLIYTVGIGVTPNSANFRRVVPQLDSEKIEADNSRILLMEIMRTNQDQPLSGCISWKASPHSSDL